MIVDINSPQGSEYLDRAIQNHAHLVKGTVIPMCPTGGHCLKWSKEKYVIPVGLWKPTRQYGLFTVESVDVCASKECRLPIDVKTKKFIDEFLGNEPPNVDEIMQSVHELLEGI